ncbi:RNA-directed DNA polymerase from mobile element jockey [Labeo rohita]|uniref:RNA-directed DNA polymerase from mobile element jockey n=1 Tax=Labeo rohita TaxID=84645 RepID=A0ABQ8MTP0_LABRO|nr:RNA-directed DNA polymerase from mobile element jockey [Labeo rohita]
MPSISADSVDLLLESFNSKVKNVIDDIAPVKVKTNKPPSQIPSEMLSDSKCNEFASFFSEKINDIRKVITTSLGKIIEKVVFNQLNNYLNSNGYQDNFQSGFRPHHSTETALVRIINDICLYSDSGKISVLVLLDLSAAFDTVNHNILLERLENWVGLSGMALSWFRSYLEGRGYYVSIGEHQSKWTSMTCGVPQGSILAPLLFSLYMLPLSQIMRKNQIAYHSYADDTQIYLALSPNDYSPIDSLCQCIDEINSWMCQNFLQLNMEKTEVIAFGSKEEVLKVNAYLDSRGQTTKNQVRNLGVILESDLSFSSHVKAVTKSAYYHLKNIARIRCFVSSQDLEKLVHAFITSRVE